MVTRPQIHRLVSGPSTETINDHFCPLHPADIRARGIIRDVDAEVISPKPPKTRYIYVYWGFS